MFQGCGSSPFLTGSGFPNINRNNMRQTKKECVNINYYINTRHLFAFNITNKKVLNWEANVNFIIILYCTVHLLQYRLRI